MSPLSENSIAVIGLGYVGLSLARVFTEAGFSVFGIDISQDKVRELEMGLSPITDISNRQVLDMLNQGFKPSTAFDAVEESAAVIFALPTPIDSSRKPDLRPLLSGVKRAVPHLRSGQLWVIESTVSPGVTEGEVLDALESQAGAILLGYSPERIDPGSTNRDLKSVPKIVAGSNADALAATANLYQSAGFNVVEAPSIKSAEAAKLLENTYRSINLALVNELAQLLASTGVDIQEVVRLASTKPFGFEAFWPGPGVGGHCIPVDPWYLQDFLGSAANGSALVDLALIINRDMPRKTARRILEVGRDTGVLDVPEPRINLLGMAYKANVNDFRESPGPELIKELSLHGVSVWYHDPQLTEPLLGSEGQWISGDIHEAELEGMTVVVQNHREYVDHFSDTTKPGSIFSAAAGHSQIGRSIWSYELN